MNEVRLTREVAPHPCLDKQMKCRPEVSELS